MKSDELAVRVAQALFAVVGYARAAVRRLRDLAPYAAMELILPGGSLLAVLLWLYRRQKKAAEFATREILSFL